MSEYDQSLRDLFAAQVIAPYIALTFKQTIDGDGDMRIERPNSDYIANFAYEMADAMLKARG